MSLHLGKTGKFPDGKISESDDGELRFATSVINGILIIDFGEPVAWIGLDKTQAKELILSLTKKVKEM